MIKIETVLDILQADDNLLSVAEEVGTSQLNFTQVSYDSRKADAATLFFAKGAAFKKEFLEKAIAAGLQIYVSQVDYQVGIPVILVKDIKQAMSLLTMEFYDHPEQKLKLLAFTGTKGKTTAAYFAYHIW